MTPVETGSPAKGFGNRSAWLKVALVISLGINLLFVGGGIARFLTHGSPERMNGISQMQLIPRKFLSDLDQARRTELMKTFREFAPGFRDGRKAAREEVVNLAVALEAEPYDETKVQGAVQAFSARSSALIVDGGKAALSLIEKLTPAERKLLARHIRQRDEGGRKKDRSGNND